MIKVCTLKGRGKRRGGECWTFANAKLKRALDFARIGSTYGSPRRVTLCGRVIRVYQDGVKRKGRDRLEMPELRRRARSCR